MGLAYLFALLVALGVLIIQILMGGRTGAHHGDLGHAAHAGHQHAHAPLDESGFWTLLLSLRFWIFAALGFGLSGSLIHFFDLAGPVVTLVIASGAGAASGLFAALTFRALARGSATTELRTSQAVGRVGRVVVACGRGTTGQVRVEIGGSSVDLLATTDDETIAHGESVLVEDLRENIAHVSRRPQELG
jgi:membrane protein implicated in regulation of membrane protease activity